MPNVTESYEQASLREANAANRFEDPDFGYAQVLAILAVVAELRGIREEIRDAARR